MTFSELVLRARGRVHDLRVSSGSIITDATKDGIRWSAIAIQDVCSEGLQELLRDLIADKLHNHYNESLLWIVLGGAISNVDGTFAFANTDWNDKVLEVTRLEELGDKSKIYDYIRPDEFFSSNYRESLTQGVFVFTSISKETQNGIVVKCLPSPTGTVAVPVEATCRLSLTSLFTVTNTEELPFNGIDDLMLDYIEKTARQIEHDPTQVDTLRKMTFTKLQLLRQGYGDELQRDN